MKTIDYSYFIESYIAGEMSPSEETWFKKELEGNESLQKEVRLRKQTDAILRKNDIVSLRSKLSSIERMRQEKPVSANKFKTPRFRYAAVITGLVVIGSLYLMSVRKESPEKIFSDNYKAPDISETTRSGSNETILDPAIECLNKGEYEKALEGFRSYLANHPATPKLEFLSGAAYLGKKDYPDAQTSFKAVIKKTDNLYIEEANWYLAMCYLKTNDLSAAKDILNKLSKYDGIHKQQAKRVLRHL